MVYELPSSTSWSSAAQMLVLPSPISSEIMVATAMGCMMYGSPEVRYWPSWARSAKLYAFWIISTFLRWLEFI